MIWIIIKLKLIIIINYKQNLNSYKKCLQAKVTLRAKESLVQK